MKLKQFLKMLKRKEKKRRYGMWTVVTPNVQIDWAMRDFYKSITYETLYGHERKNRMSEFTCKYGHLVLRGMVCQECGGPVVAMDGFSERELRDMKDDYEVEVEDEEGE